MEYPIAESPLEAIPEEEWWEILSQWQRSDATRKLWVTIQHKTLLNMLAIPFLIEVRGREIILLLPPESRSAQPKIGIRVSPPAAGPAYTKRADAEGNVKMISSTYAAQKIGDGRYYPWQIQIAIDEGFLIAEDPEPLVQ